MSRVLAFKLPAPKAAPIAVEIDNNLRMVSEHPFLDFYTTTMSLGSGRASMMSTVIDNAFLADMQYLRKAIITEASCPYLYERPALVNLFKPNLCLSPTLEKHLNGRSKVLIIDEIMVQDPLNNRIHIEALLNKLHEAYGQEHLIVIIDFAYMIEMMDDKVLPKSNDMAESSGFINTGLMWIAK